MKESDHDWANRLFIDGVLARPLYELFLALIDSCEQKNKLHGWRYQAVRAKA